MIAGLSPLTLFHVAISLVAIVSGFVVIWGLLASKRLDGWTIVFLATTLATCVTGFLFSIHGFTPALGLGILSMVVLVATIAARYAFHFEGVWRWIYAAGAVVAVYFNVFVLIVQSFQKVPALKILAPTQSEPPFVATQVLALLVFVSLGLMSVWRFRPPA